MKVGQSSLGVISSNSISADRLRPVSQSFTAHAPTPHISRQAKFDLCSLSGILSKVHPGSSNWLTPSTGPVRLPPCFRWLWALPWLLGIAWSQETPPGGSPPVPTKRLELEQLLSQSFLSNFVVVLPENTVYRIPAGTALELDSQPGDPLATGDQLRTGQASKAMLLGPGLAAALAEQSKVEVAGTDLLLRSGQVYGKTLGAVSTPRVVEMLGARVHAAGTEYLIEINPALSRVEACVAAGRLELSGPTGAPILVLPGQVVVLAPGAPLTVSPATESFASKIGWKLHYPAILNLDDLAGATGGTRLLGEPAMTASLAAYRTGDVLEALAKYPVERFLTSNAETIYRAALLLAAGQVAEAESRLGHIIATNESETSAADRRLVQALLRLMRAVRFEEMPPASRPATATEWLAESYYMQSFGTLAGARRAAQQAVGLAPDFGPALVRQAELDFFFGSRRRGKARAQKALSASPRNAQALALDGFVQAAWGRSGAARTSFIEAVRLDPRSGQGWLGLGLNLVCEGRLTAGLRALQIAVVLEPQSAAFRTHLAQGYRAVSRDAAALRELGMTAGDARARAGEEKQRARELDPQGQWRAMAFPAVCVPDQGRFTVGIAAGLALIDETELEFGPGFTLRSPCEEGRPLVFANGLGDTVRFDTGARLDLNLGYQLSRYVTLQAQPSAIWASAPNRQIITGYTEPGYNYQLVISRGDVDLLQTPLLVGAGGRIPLSNRLTAYLGADVGVMLGWLRSGHLDLACYNDEEYGTVRADEVSDSSWAFAYQARLGLDYALSRKLVVGLGYQFLGSTGHTWQLYGRDLKSDGLFTHSISARLNLNL